jgi:hypothetical protein
LSFRPLDITTGGERRTVDLRWYLDPADAERAAAAANAWIKTLRHVEVNDVPLRDRFTYRGDSLWWFAELYLHKQGVIQNVWETTFALDALAAREKPTHVRAADADPVLRQLLPQAAARFGFEWAIDTPARPVSADWDTDFRGLFYTWSAAASRALAVVDPRRLWRSLFPHSHPNSASTRAASTSNRGRSLSARLPHRKGRPGAPRPSGTAVFAHAAFWRTSGGPDGGEEGYIGKIVRELRNRADSHPLHMIGVGPRTNFKARRWWDPLRTRLIDAHDLPLTPIEDFASWNQTMGSRQMWRDRGAIERALLASAAMREHARVRDYDIWPILAAELRGVARLQFPWSARAMDEAAAALDASPPRLAVTYAEAGGWGRALILEARRRRIPTVGVQHGFIYRHWLNYQHAEDEMQPSPNNRHDRGFPRPDLTLLYDELAAEHLREHGCFPERSLRVTGSPSLDALAAYVSLFTDADRERVRGQLGAGPADRLVLVVSKYSQIGPALPALIAAVEGLKDVRLVIKPHPAETAESYARRAAGVSGTAEVTIAPPTLDLASLVASARLIVTVNSTVALDAMALGVPAVSVLLPNNLSPFVEAGAMAGATSLEALPGLLASLTKDDGAHAALVARAREFADAHGIRPDGQAAVRAVEAMAALYNG